MRRWYTCQEERWSFFVFRIEKAIFVAGRGVFSLDLPFIWMTPLLNLSTTQRYLEKVSDIEAMRWIDSIHG